MPIKGSIAHNFHEGARSEYLAQYIFSAFGTCIPVPHQEDSGIDLYCTLGERIGKRLHVNNYYSVQVKRIYEPWIFEDPKEIKWIVSLNYPLLYCIVDKKFNMIKVYQTLMLALCHSREYLRQIKLIPECSDNPFKFEMIESKIDIKLGHPIVEFDIAEIINNSVKINYKEVLKNWLELDQFNINNKILGFNLINVPENYETNMPLTLAKRWVGDIFLRDFEIDKLERANDSFFKLFSQMIHQVIYENDIEKYKSYSDFGGKLVNFSTVRDSWGIRLLANAINSGAEHFKLKDRKLLIKDESGKFIDTSFNEQIE